MVNTFNKYGRPFFNPLPTPQQPMMQQPGLSPEMQQQLASLAQSPFGQPSPFGSGFQQAAPDAAGGMNFARQAPAPGGVQMADLNSNGLRTGALVDNMQTTAPNTTGVANTISNGLGSNQTTLGMGEQPKPPVLGTFDAPAAATSNWDSWNQDDVGDLGGSEWDGQRWVAKRAVPAGTAIGRTGAKTTVAYNPYTDLDRHAFNGKEGQEPSWRRVNRWASDYQRTQGLSAQDAYNKALARLKFDYEATGQDWRRSGFDLSAVQAQDGKVPGAVPAPSTQPTPGGGDRGRGGTPPNTTPPTSTPPGGAGGGTDPNAGNPNNRGLSGAAAAMYADDPEQAFRFAMQQQGFDLDAPGMLGDFMRRRFQPLLEARMAAANLSGGGDGSYLDNIGNTIADFGGGMFQKGGGFYGNLANVAEQARGASGEYLNGLTDQNQAIQYLSQLATLKYAGSNPLVQQSRADLITRSRNQYRDYAMANEPYGRNISNFQQWLAEQQRYRGIF